MIGEKYVEADVGLEPTPEFDLASLQVATSKPKGFMQYLRNWLQRLSWWGPRGA